MGFVRNGIGNRPGEMEQEKKNQLRKDLHNLKEQLVFKLLENSNIDLQVFRNSHLYNNPNNYSLIEHIYGKLYGYDFSYVGEKRKPNGHIMDLENVKFEFIDNILTLNDGSVSLKYEVDEHCIIYLNGEDLKIASRILTDDEVKKSMKRLLDEMESYRNRRESAFIGSNEFAKSYYVKSGSSYVKKL